MADQGEVGRLAVSKATGRDEAAVLRYLSLLEDLAAKIVVLDPR